MILTVKELVEVGKRSRKRNKLQTAQQTEERKVHEDCSWLGRRLGHSDWCLLAGGLDGRR